MWRQFRQRTLGQVGLALIVFMGLVALFAPFLAGDTPIYLVKDGATYWFPNLIEYDALVADNLYANFDRWIPDEAKGETALRPLVPYGPNRQDLRARLAAPSREHWLGTDDRGRDVLSRMVWGTRVSMSVGFVAVGIAVLIGVVLGSIAGYYGGWVDALVLRVIEVVLVFPAFFLVITVMAFLPPNILNIMAVIGLTSWPGIARLVRGEFLKNKQSDYTIAARVMGLRDLRIIFRHLLPNSISPVFVAATFGVAGAILTESGLSFLGFGVPPPAASWGETLKQSQSYVDFAWWLVVFPGAAIFVTVVGFNLVGESLRDAMDPRLRE
ncbi:MAG: ABC transporter permease [Candidatus Hydrogenedentota bacterium]